ncbi:FAD-binding domain-containing protein [Lactarius quietus]|nr:FAD-binding domain-containing protein [Lactarius quietus]
MDRRACEKWALSLGTMVHKCSRRVSYLVVSASFAYPHCAIMLRVAFLGYALILLPLFASAFAGQLDFRAKNIVSEYPQIPLVNNVDYRLVCHAISRSISRASEVFYPESPAFARDISHWANSSSQISTCSVRPGTAEDLSLIVRELGLTRTPFAIKCSGHSTNPGFSSTPGVQISMVRFRDIVLNEEEGTVEIGAGLIWTEVFSYLVPKGLNVVGGRLVGVGVGGFILGGGYSWKTNQYSLTIDTVTAFELVLPNGHVKVVTEKDEDLWFALRGGSNNYGIVTKYTLKTHKQTDVWGALLAFEGDQIEPAYTAFTKWLSVDHDRKATQLGAIAYSNGTVGFQLVLFYDRPNPPEGLYDDLLNLPNSAEAIIKGDFLNFVSSIVVPPLDRAYVDGVPMLQYSAPILKATIDDVKIWGDKLSEKDENTLVIFSLDAFESDIFTHGGPSAYPPDRSHTILPSSLFVAWSDESLDHHMYDSIRSLSASIIEAGIKDGQDLKDAAHYTNYALYGTPLEKMYGKNVKRLRAIKKKYDTFNVMDLTGGFKF